MDTRPNPLIRQYHDKLQDTVDLIDELVELGINYEFFMNAQISHKNLKKIKKLLEYIG
jgi:glutaredoxin-related protein